MSNFILHISDTNIENDSRILKEMRSLKSFSHEHGLKLYGVGLEEPDPKKSRSSQNQDLNLFTCKRGLSRLFSKIKSVKHAVTLFELFFFSLKYSLRMRPKIIHCHDALVLPIGLVIKVICGAKLIYDAHELESNKNLQSSTNSLVTKFIEAMSWRHIDLFISVSPSINKWYVEKFGDKKNIVILNAPEFSTQVEESRVSFGIRHKFGISNSEKIFVYLGIFSSGRGIPRALKVFARNDIDSHILFVGWGAYDKLIEGYSSKNINIHIHQPVDHQDVVPLVSECDFGLCMIENISLSDYLCLPNKLFECCFAGLPVLASDFPELSRVIQEHEIGETCGESEADMVAAVLALSNTEKDFRFRDIESLGWQIQSNRLVEAYIEILEEEHS